MKKGAILNYKVIPDLNLIIDYYSGTLTLTEILRLKGKQAKDPLWEPHFNTLSDMRDAFIAMDEEEIKTLASYQVKDEKWRVERKTASLTNEANHVVFEKLFNRLKPKNTKVLVKAFSTFEATISWLGYNEEASVIINDTLTELRKAYGLRK